MLCTFTTETGNLIIRSDDIRVIQDGVHGTTVRWDVCGTERSAIVTGTAIENRDRIQQEELDLIDRVNQHHLQAQQQAAMIQQMVGQMQPKVQRGKQSEK